MCITVVDMTIWLFFSVCFSYPQILNHLQLELAKWNRTAMPPTNLPLDPRGDPRFWDHTWTNFGDYSVMLLSNTVT